MIKITQNDDLREPRLFNSKKKFISLTSLSKAWGFKKFKEG